MLQWEHDVKVSAGHTYILPLLLLSEMEFRSMRLRRSWIVGFSVAGLSILCVGKVMVLQKTFGYLHRTSLEQKDWLGNFTGSIQRHLNVSPLFYMLPFLSDLWWTSQNLQSGPCLIGQQDNTQFMMLRDHVKSRTNSSSYDIHRISHFTKLDWCLFCVVVCTVKIYLLYSTHGPI